MSLSGATRAPPRWPTTSSGGSRSGRFERCPTRRRIVFDASSAVIASASPPGVAAVLALSVGLATTLWQFRVAQAERARAERRFDDVRRLANTVIFDLHDAIAPLPGSTDARRLLIQRALTYVDGLAAEASGDLPLQRELARAYERLAEVQGRPGNANLGDRDGARSSLEKSLGVMEAPHSRSSRDSRRSRRVGAPLQPARTT